LDSKKGSSIDAPVVPSTHLQNQQGGNLTNVYVERQRTEEVIWLSSDDEFDGDDVELAAAAGGEVPTVMNNTAASKHQSVALITQSGSLQSQHAGTAAAAANDAPAVISNALSKEQDVPVILVQHAVPTSTGNVSQTQR
jgi:hypothetical protein